VQSTATPTPVPLKVVNLASYRTPAGGAWFLGEVQNDGDEFLDRVQLQLSLFNGDGELLERVTTFVVADVVPAHGKAAFAFLLSRLPSGGFASYEIVVLSAQPIKRWGNRHPYLVVDQISGEMEGGTFIVEGTVYNGGQEDARDVRVTLTCYATDGKVAGVRQVDLGTIRAGQEQPFSLSIVPAVPAVRVQGVAWGMQGGG